MILYSTLFFASIFFSILPMELKKTQRLPYDAPASLLYKVQKNKMPNQILLDLQSIRRKPQAKRHKELQGYRIISFTASRIACASIPS